MEFVILFVALLFILPLPSKWKFVWQLRFLGLALLALTGGLTLTQSYGQAGLIGGIALMLSSLIFFYLTVRPPRAVQRVKSEKK